MGCLEFEFQAALFNNGFYSRNRKYFKPLEKRIIMWYTNGVKKF